jgi:ketosteroid isomerase-like protein
MTERNVELARRGFAAAVRGDFAAIGELLDPEVKWHGGDPAAVGACRNRDQVLMFMRRSETVGGGRFELVDIVDAGDKVVVILRPPPEGAEPAAPVANLTTFRNGKVVEMVHYPSPEAALAAAGV